MERVGLGRRREGEFFLYGSVCYEQVGVSSFFFGVAGVLYNCTITHGQLCFVWAGEGRRGGSGGVLIYGRFYTLVLYRSVVGKRRYHGAMGCEEEGGGGLWIGQTMPTQGTSVPCHLDINQFRRLTNVFILSIWCALRT